MKLNKAVSNRIIQLLNERDWSAYRLSAESGVPLSTISNILLGKCHSCNLSTILNICRGFGITFSELFDTELFAPENLDDD